MDSCSRAEFERLVKNASVLSNSPDGPRVYLTPDQYIVKVFWPKKLFSSDRIVPYGRRFARCAQRLSQRGFDSVVIEKVIRCSDLGMHFVIYELVPGPSIRELGEHEPAPDEILMRLANYLGKLHQSGVYFKALHLGNIIVQRDGSFALIDFHSTKFYAKPVSVNRRIKNLKNMLHYAQDYALLEAYGLDSFISEYLHHSGMMPAQQNAFLKTFETAISK